MPRNFDVLLVLVALISCPGLPDAGGAETWWPEERHPAPNPATTPDWALKQKLNFSRWDGGRIEVAKAFLSGWVFYNKPSWPDVLDAANNWYDPRTVGLAKDMGYNFLWLTLSVGFSVEMERGQWEQLRAYVAECHRQGIRVAAYMSLANMFVDDMLLRVPESKDWLLIGNDGKPQPYGAANFARMGRITRMLADVSHPGWRAYMKKRVDAAIELGFDAIEYDNSFYSVAPTGLARERYRRFLEKNGFVDNPEVRRAYEMEQIRETYREMLAHARTKKPDMVVFANTNYDNFALNRGATMISTEDGKEPGYYQLVSAHEITAEDLLPPCYADVQTTADTEPFRADRLQTNLGTLRLLKGLDEGWKPVLVEFGGRRNGHRFLNHLPPLGIQLAIGECNAALCSYQGYQEGRAQLDLYRRSAEVVPMMQAAAAAHRFVAENQDLFLGSRLFGDVAVVMDDRLKGYDLLKRLARENVQFEVLFEDRLKPELLKRYQRVLVSDARLISDEGLAALVAYARERGKMMVVGESGAMNLWGQPRAQNPLAVDGPWQKRPANASEDDLVRFLKDGVAARFEVVDRPEVLFTVTRPRCGEEKKLIVHVMNYRKRPLEDVRLRCPSAKALSLRTVAPDCSRIRPVSAPGEWLVPNLGVYSILVLTL